MARKQTFLIAAYLASFSKPLAYKHKFAHGGGSNISLLVEGVFPLGTLHDSGVCGAARTQMACKGCRDGAGGGVLAA